MDVEKPIGVAAFGAGRIANVHVGNLARHPGVKLYWLVEEITDVAKALLVKENIQGTEVCSAKDAQQVFQDKRVSAVVICTPTDTHEDIIKTALKHGKHVFCEKPIARCLQAVEECYEMAKQNKLILFCAFNRRFDSQNQRMFELARSGELGRIRVVKTSSRDPPGMPEAYLKTSGGIFIDSCVHDIDMICWIVGEPPISVYATGSATMPQFAKYEDVDTCAIVLRFPGGVVGHIEVSRESHMSLDNSIEILCSEGHLRSGNLRKDNLTVTNLQGVTLAPFETIQLVRYRDAYKNEMHHFIQQIARNDLEVAVTAEQTIMVNKVALACKESLIKHTEIQL